jgi:two-component system, LytTR family, response regulator
MISHSNEMALVTAGVPDGWRSPGEITGNRIRLVLIDEDSAATSAVHERLRGRDDFEVIGEASSAEEALRKIESLQPDAIFVDVEMMESARFDVARLFGQPAKPVIVFVTAHKHYALQAFDLGAADYLLKPICDDRFQISLNRIREQLAHRRAAERPVERETATWGDPLRHGRGTSGRITVTDRRRTHIFEPSEIEWIGAAGDYTELHVRGATHLLREPLTVLLSRLPAHVFCRIHRSFVVNLSRVTGFKTLRNQDLLVKLKDRTVLRASRTFSDELRKAITQQCVWRQPISSD